MSRGARSLLFAPLIAAGSTFALAAAPQSPPPAPGSYYWMTGVAALITAVLGGVAGLLSARQYRKDPVRLAEDLTVMLNNRAAAEGVWRLLRENLISAKEIEPALRLLLTNPSEAGPVWTLIADYIHTKRRADLVNAVLVELFTNPDSLAKLADLLKSPMTKVASSVGTEQKPSPADLEQIAEVLRSVLELKPKQVNDGSK